MKSISNIADDVLEDAAALEPAAFIDWAVRTFGDRLALALSLSVEDSLLLHHLDAAAKQHDAVPRVFTLDTGRLPEESYVHLERLRERYTLPIEVMFPQLVAIEDLYRRKGPLSYLSSIDDRKECCAVRKVEPLGRALSGVDAWLTGLRRAQSPTRAAIERIERDGERCKLSPLADVDDATLWSEARRLGVPIHPLHDRGYPSIGCAPCTRAVAAGEPARAGRWWWEDATQKECGIHARSRT